MKVSLRVVEEADLEGFFVAQADVDQARQAAFPSRTREAFFPHWRKVLADPHNFVRTVLVDGVAAGHVSAWTHDGQRNVGYWIARAFCGRGVASEAVRLLLELERGELTAFVISHNVASLRVLEKNGFRRVGTEGDDVVLTHAARE